MSENLTSDIEVAQKAVPNSQIAGENHAKDKFYNPFPTIQKVLGTPNTVTNFKYDAAKKNLYSIETKDWNPTHSTTLAMYEKVGRKYRQRPEETAEQKTLDSAKFPDGTFKYYISYTMFKRMMGADGQEYLVRHGYLHGISVMNMEWKYLKQDFDYHYEPVFEPSVGNQSNYFQVTYGEEINQIKKFHTTWDKDVFERSLKDIPFPGNTKTGVTFKVGYEGAMGIATIPSLEAFRSKSFDDLYEYASTGNKEALVIKEQKSTKK